MVDMTRRQLPRQAMAACCVRRAAATRLRGGTLRGPLFIVLIVGAAARVAAQARLASPLQGQLFDSLLTGQPLVGAEVWRAGDARVVLTDSAGRFQLDDVPAGTHQLAFTHPVLERAGLGVLQQEVRVSGDGARVVVRLSTPSVQRIATASCAPIRDGGASADRGGVVMLAPSNVAPVEADVRWTEVDRRDGRWRLVTRRVTATRAPSGLLVACGVPEELDVQLSVRWTEGYVWVRDVGPAVRRRAVVTTVPRGQVSISPWSLIGRVLTPDGQPITGAQVGLVGTPGDERTGDDGRFRVSLPSDSSVTLRVRAVGFVPLSIAVDAMTMRSVDVVLDPVPASLAALTVRANPGAGRLAEFEVRRRRGIGGFLGPDEIAGMPVQRSSELFRRLPGWLVDPTGATVRSVRRQDCVRFFLDGTLFPGNALDAVIPSELLAIEAYVSGAQAPIPYNIADCGIVLLWSRASGTAPP